MWSAGSRSEVFARGFSLLELLVVVLIISLSVAAIAAALPRIGAGPAIELAATRLAAGFKKARTRAVAGERVVAVAIDPGSRRFRIDDQGAVRLPDSVEILPLRSSTIRFYPDGGADSAAFRLRADQRMLRIDVSPLTGRVTVR